MGNIFYTKVAFLAFLEGIMIEIFIGTLNS